MQFMVYFLWGSLILCFGAIVVSVIYSIWFSKDDDKVATATVAEEEQQEAVRPLNQRRWAEFLALAELDAGIFPDADAERVQVATQQFGVQEQWLYGRDVPMFPCLSFHNNMAEAFTFINTRLEETNDVCLVVTRPRGIELDESVYEASLVMCFVTPLEYNGEQTRRYWPVTVFWEWGYPPEQVQSRQLIYIAAAAGCRIVGVEVDMNDIYHLLEGHSIPAAVQKPQQAPTWQPLDIAHPGMEVMGCGDTVLAAEEIKRRIREMGWDDSALSAG